MKQTKLIMGMPITVEIIGDDVADDVAAVFRHFRAVDRRYSTYKSTSEISRINGGCRIDECSSEMLWVLELCEATKRATNGYFDIAKEDIFDPSGLVKGWAIQNAANLLLLRGRTHFYIEAGGDIQTRGHNYAGKPWRVGIRNPFNTDEVIKVVTLDNAAIATSGAYIRGDHIYNPLDSFRAPKGVASLTIIAPTIYDADRFATAAYAMGTVGITFVEQTPGLEGYAVDTSGIATYTSGFERYVV